MLSKSLMVTLSGVLSLGLVAGCQEHVFGGAVELEEQVAFVDLELDAGDVTVVPSPDGVARVDYEIRHWCDEPEPEVYVDGERLVVRLDCSETCGFCSGRFVLEVPETASARLRTGAGNVEVEQLQGDVEATVEAGSIEVLGVLGVLKLKTDAGEVRGRNLGSVRVKATNEVGDIDLSFAERPERVVAETDVGSVNVDVPCGCYRIETEVDVGDVRVSDLRHDCGADRLLRASSDVGSVRLRGR